MMILISFMMFYLICLILCMLGSICTTSICYIIKILFFIKLIVKSKNSNINSNLNKHLSVLIE